MRSINTIPTQGERPQEPKNSNKERINTLKESLPHLTAPTATLLASTALLVADVKGAVVATADHDGNYDVQSGYSDYSITLTGTTAANIQEIESIVFDLGALAPGIPSNMVQSTGINVTQGGLPIGDLEQINTSPTQGSSVIASVSTNTTIAVNPGGGDITFHFSLDTSHNIPAGNVIATANPNASENADIDWSTEGVDGTVAFRVEGTVAVPEPSSSSLLGLGALGLLIRRKR